MKTTRILVLLCAGALLSGCTSMEPARLSESSTMDYVAAKEPIATSLFPSDQAVMSDEAVARILASKLELPAKARLALMKFPDAEGSRYYGRYYWRDEEYLKLQQSQVDALMQTLRVSDQIAEVTPLPSLMTPTRLSIPVLREAAVRMQADLLLVFRVSSDTYSQNRALRRTRLRHTALAKWSCLISEPVLSHSVES